MKKNKFGKIDQVGVVVKDLKETMETMKRLFGMEPDVLLENIRRDGGVYRDEPGNFNNTLCIYHFENIDLEFIQDKSEGESVWKTHMEKHGPGVHHIGFPVDNMAEAKEQMASNGVELVQHGLSNRYTPGLVWAYFDTDSQLGFDMEVVNVDEVKAHSES